MAESEEFHVLDSAYSDEFQKYRSVSNKPISNIGWFRADHEGTYQKKQQLQQLLNKVPKEQFYKSVNDKRPDQIFRKTKIISTLGKYSSTLVILFFIAHKYKQEAICKLIEEGTNIFRINMSTIQNKEHKVLIEMIKKAQKLTKTKVGILIDLQGPVIRTGEFINKSTVHLKAGQEFRICCKKKILGDESFVCVDFQDLENKLKVGDHIIVDFGGVCMRVIDFEDEADFLMSKQLESGIEVKHSVRQIRQGKNSISFQGTRIRGPPVGLRNMAQNLEKERETLQQQQQDQQKDGPIRAQSYLEPPLQGLHPHVQSTFKHHQDTDEEKEAKRQAMLKSQIQNIQNDIIKESSNELILDELQDIDEKLKKQFSTELEPTGMTKTHSQNAAENMALQMGSGEGTTGISGNSTNALEVDQLKNLEMALNDIELNQQQNQMQQNDIEEAKTQFLTAIGDDNQQTSSHRFIKSDSFSRREYEQEIEKKKKKFKVRFDEAYQRTHEEKIQVEKEFFQNALNTKRYESAQLQKYKSTVELDKQQIEEKGTQRIPTFREKQNINVSNLSSTKLTAVMEESNVPEGCNKQNSNGGETGEHPNNEVEKKDSLTNLGNPIRQVASAQNMLASGTYYGSHDDLNSLKSRPPGIPIPNRRKKKVTKERKVIVCKVEFNCELKPHKPLYFPEFDYKNEFDLSVVTIKDIRDIHSSIKLGVDFVSISYVESKDDILEVRDLLSIKGRHIKVIAKIQNRKALQNFDEILEVSDGIIIARGYLGLDLKLEGVTYVQEYLIKKCNLAGKPVILSTQIMESMVKRLRPTRAEVSDISNAVYEGIDCCILSSETHTGPFYDKACEIMSKICFEAEQHIDYEKNYEDLQTMIMQSNIQLSMAETICNCAVKAAYEMDAKLIIVFTNSGTSANLVSKYKPKCPILAVSASDKSAKQIMISRGIFYLLVGSLIGAESLLDKVKLEAMAKGLVKKGDFVIVTTGVEEGLEGSTNLLKIIQI